MSTIGVVTTEGFTKSAAAASNEGWFIRPKKFALSETKGLLSKTRSMSDLQPLWYNNWIGGREVLSPESIMFYCSVPPEQANSQKDINEIYLFAEDANGANFLLYLAQPSETVIYSPEGTTYFKLQVTIANLDIAANYQFIYTQANEILAHNQDPLSHPDYQKRFETFGFPIDMNNHSYVGQLIDEVPLFTGNVVDGDAVYYNSSTGRYDQALADSSVKAHCVGFAVRESLYSAVRSGGYLQTPYTSFSNDTIVFLSNTNAGKLTTTRTSIPLGIHLKGGLCYFPPASGYLKWAGIGGSGRNPVYANANITAANLDTILADLTNGSFTVTLPTVPIEGDDVRVIDTKGLARGSNLTVSGSGAAINGVLEPFIIDVNNAMISFLYDATGNNWLVDLGGSRFAGYTE